MIRTKITAAVWGAMLALPTAAFAQTADEGYGSIPGIREDATLAYTGLDVFAIAAIGAALLMAGVALHLVGMPRLWSRRHDG